MLYIQFYAESTGYVEGSTPPRFDPCRRQPIEALGDRAVIVVDGRVRRSSIGPLAQREGARRGYRYYRVFKGDSFTRSRPVSGLWPIDSGRRDNTAMSAYYGA